FFLPRAQFSRVQLCVFFSLSVFIVFVAFYPARAIFACRSDQCSKLPPHAMVQSPHSILEWQETCVFPRARFSRVKLCPVVSSHMAAVR
ncbi:hypothetical protein F5148DRAFT_1223726, partial [Russula earlei]